MERYLLREVLGDWFEKGEEKVGTVFGPSVA
jgi:hypothetical protein